MARMRQSNSPEERPLLQSGQTVQTAQTAQSVALTFPTGFELPAHTHAWPQLIYAARGVVSATTERGVWVVPPTRALWVASGVPHALAMKGTVALRTIYFEPTVAPVVDSATGSAVWSAEEFGCKVVEVPALLRELILSVVATHGLNDHDVYDRARLDLLRHLIAATPHLSSKLPLPTDPRARKVARSLLENLEQPRTVASACRGCGASRRTIERLFQAETGMSLGRWRQQARLLESLRWLAEGRSVTSAAAAVGYRSPSAFVAAFRSALGATPARYFEGAD